MKVGRPSKDIEKRITIGLSEEEYSKIKYLADRDGVSISEYIRKALRKVVK